MLEVRLAGAEDLAAGPRGYVGLVLAPSAPAVSLHLRAGFVVPGGAAARDRPLVRPGR